MNQKRAWLIVGAAICLCGATLNAQTPGAGSCDMPVVVADYLNQPVRNLLPTDFSARLDGSITPVAGASIDAGPKRISIVVDASSKVPAEEWKLEAELAPELVSHARPGDQLFLVVVGNESASGAFASSAELTARLRDIGTSRQNGATDEKIYDALAEAARHLNAAQFGDTIFLFGHYQDSGSTTSLDTLRNLILEKRLRFFGMSFQDRFADIPGGFKPNKPIPGFHSAALESLSGETGYYFSFRAVRDLAYPGQLPLFKNFLSDVYTWMAEPYRVQISTPATGAGRTLEMSISGMEARKVNKNGLHYPHTLYSCTQQPMKPPDVRNGTPAQ
jgi:hypothetical protein